MLDSKIESRTEVIGASLDSYRRLADVFHHVLSEQSLDALLERVADTLMDLLQYDTLIIYEADEAQRVLIPVLARDQYVDEIMSDRAPFGRGITGYAVEAREAVLANHAHLDPRTQVIPGTPDDPESLMSIPLITKGSVKGALNVYRQGEDATFSREEFEIAKRFGDAAALAIDNAHRRAELELAAQTDSLTGLYNHRHFHERLRAELNRASRKHDSCALLVMDIDDFKKVNDVFGHAAGDAVLVAIADLLRSTVRASDVACRLGGEEFAVILSSCDAGDALGLAARITSKLESKGFEPAGKITVSIGVAQGPQHAANPRELVACADAAMLTAKAKGKNRTLIFEEGAGARPREPHRADVRSIAHLKMLQSLAGKLNRLNDVKQIGSTIANELRTLIDYHSCRVYLTEGQSLVPIAFKGEVLSSEEDIANWTVRIGEGVTGRVGQTGSPLLVPNALDCEWAVQVPGTTDIEESLVAVPLNYGARVVGAIIISKLGIKQFDEDDVRLLEVLAGHAAVALENARLYENQRREAEHAKALLQFADTVSLAPSEYVVGNESVKVAARVMEARQCAMWMYDERADNYVCVAHHGFVGDRAAEPAVRMRLSREYGDGFLSGRKEPFVLPASEVERRLPLPATFPWRTLAVAPLHGVKGWITVRHPDPDGLYFDEDRMRQLAGISYQASTAMQKAMLYKDQKESADIANSLLDVSRELATAEDLNAILNRTVELAARILGSPRTTVWLPNQDSGDLVAEAQIGYEGTDLVALAKYRVPLELARPLLLANEPFSANSSDLVKQLGLEFDLVRGHMAVAPLKLDGGGVGALVVGAPALGDYEFSERKMKLLAGIAHQARLAINNAHTFLSLERTFISTVEALANALEAKDEYTSSHARWITDMALEVGGELGLEPSTMKNLELGALFHDIGKIGIPTGILLKEGPLNDEEWAVIRTHPELGEKILSPIEFLAEVRPIVRACHEHWDGRGYPDGLRGEDIPLEARIILVVDAFHAMTSDRPYRMALSLEEACKRLTEARGTEFDPRVVDAMLRLMELRPELTLVD